MAAAFGADFFAAGGGAAGVEGGVDEYWADIGRGVIVEQRSWNSAFALVS